MIVIVDYPDLMFTIPQSRVCPALMVPVAICDPGGFCVQSPTKRIRNPDTGVSVTVKEPGPNVTARTPSSVRENEDG